MKHKITKDEIALMGLASVCIILALCFFLTSCTKDTSSYIRDRVLQLKGTISACTGIQVKAPSGNVYNTSSDAYIRDRVLQLKGAKDACTGIQVKAPSGNVYTLTAGHCKEILDEDNSAMSIDEQGNEKRIYMLDVDEGMDLMLMTSPNVKSIEVAKKTMKHEHVHTLTHGHMHATYRTDGELLEEQKFQVHEDIVITELDAKQCEARQFHETVDAGFVTFCVRDYYEMMMTAQVYPGSSGGPVLDDSGKLVGIVSISEAGTIYSGAVQLHQIQQFLKTR